MTMKLAIFCLFFIKVAYTQYYSTSYSNYPSYSYNYYTPTPSTVPAYLPTPTFGPTYPSTPPPTFGPAYPAFPPPPSFGPTYTTKQTKSPKRSISQSQCPKCSSPTATAYFLSTPNEKIKATVLPKDKKENSIIPPPVYSCPLCNNFADVPLNPKLPPPPPVGSPVLPGILDEIPTIVIPKDLVSKVPSPILSAKKKSVASDMYEKHKYPKNLRFDQELLEGFLTGLGITL